MKIIAALFVILVILLILFFRHSRKTLESAVTMAGFAYDPVQDIFYSEMDAWQRKFGYCQMYDEASPPLALIFHCEPVRFDYDGRSWLIELWKGQYGMTMGAEVGVYSTDRPSLELPGLFDGVLYENTDTLLEMTFALIRNGRMLFYRRDKHWWLTGFILGAFGEPEELQMQVSIAFPKASMRNAFLAALFNLGYGKEEVVQEENTVIFFYDRPHSPQPLAMDTPVREISQRSNQMLCEEFAALTKDIEGTLDKITYVKRNSPSLYRRLPQERTHRKVYTGYKTIMKRRKEDTRG